MKHLFSYISGSSLIILSFIAGSALAVANVNFATPTPGPNDTKPHFEQLNVDNENDGGYFETQASGGILNHADLPGSVGIDAGGLVVLPEINSEVISSHAGIRGIGLLGIRGQNGYNDGSESTYTYGRFGLEGIVRTASNEVRGYVGFLEYDENASGTVISGNIPTSQMASDTNAHYVPISQGIPWAFYTEDNSKFGDVEVTGSIVADPDAVNAVEFDTDIDIHGRTLVFGEVENLDDIEITEPLWVNQSYSGQPETEPMNQVFMHAKYFRSDVNQTTSLTPVTEVTSCPVGSIRVSCQLRVDHPTNSSPFRGVTQTGARDCTAHGVIEPGKYLQFYLFASCLRPSIPGTP